MAVLTAVGLGWLVTTCAAQPVSDAHGKPAAFEWQVSSATIEGLDPAPFLELHEDIVADVYGNVDRLVVVRDGKLVFSERYLRDYREISRGHKDALGCGFESCGAERADHPYNYYNPDLHPYYRGRDVHALQSATKAVAATLIGVALQRGDLGGIDQSLLPLFGGYDLSAVDERLKAATVEHVLTMRTGIAWIGGPLDENNISLRMERSDDWIQFVLSQPSDAAPGEKYRYSDGGSQLLSGILRQSTGRHAHLYAEEHLFGPLGIADFHWKTTPTGHADTEGGLYLEAEDLAKIGLLYLQDGVWQGRRLLAEGWVDSATFAHNTGLRGDWSYGYQWWLLERRGVEIWAARGFGGQLMIVLPEHRLVAVTNGWNVFGGDHQKIRDRFLDAALDSVFAPG